MNNEEQVLIKTKTLLVIFVSVLLLSFHYYLIYFINSTYIKQYVGESAVGYVYTLGAILNIILFLSAPYFLRRKGNFKLVIILTLIEAATLIGLALTTWTPLVVLLFIIHSSIVPLLLYCMDIFIEKVTPLNEMGSIRGIYLTMTNIPPAITPFIVGLILTKSEYWKLYFISAIFLVPFIILIISYFKKFKDSHYPNVQPQEVIFTFYRNKKLFDVFLDMFLLNFFYGWMVIYMPIYLHDHIGFAWSEIGIMFSIMLLPFMIFQIPIGKLEDIKHDEKDILILGFTIMALATMLIPFIQSTNFVIWTAILFITRIGASIVEVSGESYFFKHVTSDNAGFISMFRLTRSLPFIISPAIFSICILFFDFKYIFLVLGFIMLLGVRHTFQLSQK